MAHIMERLKDSAGKMAAECAKDDGPDLKVLAALVDEHAKLLDSDEAAGYEGTDEMKKQIAQLREDLDATAEKTREIEKAGLKVRGGRIAVPSGRRARLEMLADGRAFADDDQAKRFGAWALVQVARQLPNRRIFEAMPREIKEINDDVVRQGLPGMERTAKAIGIEIAKAGDIDPSVSGIGAELVSEEFRSELIRDVEAVGTIFVLCRRVPLATMGQTTWPKRTGGLASYWTDVAAEITRSGLTFDTVTMTPKKVGTLSGIPNEMFVDPGLLIDAGQLIGLEISYTMADRLDNTVVNADGTADHGGFTGILQSATIASEAAAAGNTTVATLDGADIMEIPGALPVAYALPNARWAMSLSVKGHVRGLTATTGVPLFDRGVGQAEPASIDGYPYALGTRMPAKSAVTAGTAWAVFGDFRMAMYVGMIRAIRIDLSKDVYFTSDMTGIRGVMHVAIAEADADALLIAKTAAT